ncbi:MAG: 16S rRNA (uracil(1498)-N(3))-methyltransferase [Pseudomonadota bacterium]
MVNRSSSAEAAQPTRSFRLHLDATLGDGARIEPPKEAAHYIATVMRAGQGDRFLVFNGRDGEWLAEIESASKRAVTLRLLHRTRPPAPPPDLWLLFAPIKKARTDFIVEKACELGCRRILPVITERTQSDRVNIERLQAHVIEAAEQCELVFAPEVAAPQTLKAALGAWPAKRALHFCDETRGAPPFATIAASPPAAILIGPEGGFSPAEAAWLRGLPFIRPASLGPRVLRADTAAAAAITLWQDAVGDFRASETQVGEGPAPPLDSAEPRS